MLALGTAAPDFSLPEVASGHAVSLADFAGKDALLVAFLCAHCPYVVHVAPELARLGRDYAGKSVAIVGITANDTARFLAGLATGCAEGAPTAHARHAAGAPARG